MTLGDEQRREQLPRDSWLAPGAERARISKVTAYATFGGVRNWIFVRVDTDTGLYGWGEASTEQWDSTVMDAIRSMGSRLIGQDPIATEHNWQRLSRHAFWRGGPILQTALSGLDQALWDIRGKAFGVPVYRLLGGPTREWVKTYRHVGIYQPDALVEEAKAYVDQGIRTLKTGAWVQDSSLTETHRLERVVRRLEDLRGAVGEHVDILVDNHGQSTPDEAIRLIMAIAGVRPLWIEEPIAPEGPELLRHVSTEARRRGISVALGERLFSRWETRQVLEEQLVDILQPDLCHAGGITETMKIASMADVYRCSIAPHNPGGPVSTAAAAHVAMVIPNFSILEYCPDEPRRSEVQMRPWRHSGDKLFVPEVCGLGVELDVDAITNVPTQDIAVPTLAFREDGSVADV